MSSRSASSEMRPSRENLAALDKRLNRHWRTLVWSACMTPRSGARWICSVLTFFSISGLMVEATPSIIFGHVEALQVQIHLAGFDLGQIEDVVDQRQQVLAGDR